MLAHDALTSSVEFDLSELLRMVRRAVRKHPTAGVLLEARQGHLATRHPPLDDRDTIIWSTTQSRIRIVGRTPTGIRMGIVPKSYEGNLTEVRSQASHELSLFQSRTFTPQLRIRVNLRCNYFFFLDLEVLMRLTMSVFRSWTDHSKISPFSTPSASASTMGKFR